MTADLVCGSFDDDYDVPKSFRTDADANAERCKFHFHRVRNRGGPKRAKNHVATSQPSAADFIPPRATAARVGDPTRINRAEFTKKPGSEIVYSRPGYLDGDLVRGKGHANAAARK